MAKKLAAVPLPELAGKFVLDVGCDHGAWCRIARARGADRVLGLDRGRVVEGKHVDLAALNRKWIEGCDFDAIDVGKQWHEFGKFDVVLCLSMYHHIYQNCGDHAPIWFWLWRHCAAWRDFEPGGVLLWENPVGTGDPVVRMNVSRDCYTRDAIMTAAERYFEIEHIGPGHVPTREVWRCRPKYNEMLYLHRAKVEKGAGGASAAFQWAGGRRIAEIEHATGMKPIPGSLNLRTWEDFPWERGYYRAEILDPVDRKDLSGEWRPRWARFYPVEVNGIAAMAFRFEGDRYDPRFVELLAPRPLRDVLLEGPVTLVTA